MSFDSIDCIILPLMSNQQYCLAMALDRARFDSNRHRFPRSISLVSEQTARSTRLLYLICTYFVSNECVILHDTITQSSVSVENPHVCFWSNEFSSECKSSADAKSSKSTWIEPRQRSSWSKNVGCRCDEISSIAHQNCIVGQLFL